MKDLLIAAGVVGLLYLVYKKAGPSLVPTLTPPPPVPLAPDIGNEGIIVGGAYGVPPWGTVIGSGGAVSPVALPHTVPYPTSLPAPPPMVGGIAGGAGTGGAPLGGPLTPGVSPGTGTSANGFGIGVPTVDILGRGRPGAPGFDVWGRPLTN